MCAVGGREIDATDLHVQIDAQRYKRSALHGIALRTDDLGKMDELRVSARNVHHKNIVFKIDPRKWEEIIAASYEKHGFDEVILTQRSGDFGRDVVAVKRGFWSVRVID